MPANHLLKTHRGPFEAVWQGSKTFEFRKDDRKGGFQEGDSLILQEWDEEAGRPRRRLMVAYVTYVLRGPRFGLPEGFAVLSIRVDVRTEGVAGPFQGLEAAHAHA